MDPNHTARRFRPDRSRAGDPVPGASDTSEMGKRVSAVKRGNLRISPGLADGERRSILVLMSEQNSRFDIVPRVVVFDQAGDLSDGAAGPTSTQAVSAALASCTAGTLRVYAERKGWSLDGLEVEVTTTYEGPNPNLFTVTIGWPPQLDDEQVERLARIAGKCPVHRLLTEAATVEIETA